MSTATIEHPTAEQVATQVAVIAEPGDILEARCITLAGEVRSFWKRAADFSSAEFVASLQSLNDQGYNVYVGYNPRNAIGAKGNKSVDVCRTVFIDDDSGTAPDVMLARIAAQGLPVPTTHKSSGHGHWYVWKLAEAIDPETFARVQKDLAHTFGTDRKVFNPERIGRLAGFINHKPPQAMASIVECDPSRTYELDQITDHLLMLDDTPAPVFDIDLDAAIRQHEAHAKATYNGSASVIDAFNDAHDITTMIRGLGYTQHPKPDHWYRPGKTSGNHSAIVDTHKNRVHLFSDNDNNNDGKFDGFSVQSPFDLFRINEHRGDLKAAVRAAAELLNMSHKQQAEKNGTAGHIESNEVTTTPPEPLDDHAPFPVDELPAVMRDFVTEGVKANQIAPDFIAPPLISAMGAAIGNRAVALLKAGFAVPPNIWTAVVAASGEGKSPAMRAVLASPIRRQSQLVQRYNDACEEYQKMLAEWEAKPKDERGVKPQHPTMEHNIVSDATTEALAVRLMASPAGLLAAVDELAGNFKSYNAYKKGGNDREAWLGFYDAGYVKIDRKTAAVATIIVKRAFVALTGGIQPGVLAGVMDDDDFDAGLAARFLFVLPPTQRKTWSEDIINPAVSEAIGATFESLYSLPFNTGEDGIEPAVLPLTTDAKAVWGKWFDEVENELRSFVDTETAYATALPKVRTAAARLALVFQLVSYVTNDNNAKGNHVDAFNMGRAVNVMRWFKNEQKRVYASLHMTKAHRRLLKIVETIRSDYGGSVSVRDWQRRRGLKTSEHAASELDTVIAASMGEWTYHQKPTGGHSEKRITLK